MSDRIGRAARRPPIGKEATPSTGHGGENTVRRWEESSDRGEKGRKASRKNSRERHHRRQPCPVGIKSLPDGKRYIEKPMSAFQGKVRQKNEATEGVPH